ncbi:MULTISPECIES: 4'-phosphopantetheinyl transferase superfamily protein [unclassified Azospirillum]|uniref:4'-phosphopantetheinyl transferase family protein n=1 Tax=unclassified Azospirillum TaxID=2630922 RepID=UPI000B6CFBE3|nr:MULTISPECIES: 4'-phosphopantetheinyl transferase superfamily protein [unclassified Azospirillum]SNS85524.1 phosphopantetheine--protein transferase domain-containing protein [Azospirillum sp. RU38E]SNT02979.1 phosphopantetheine--protein transferase domain-containing protein [Azospirillum sp. RU37A]
MRDGIAMRGDWRNETIIVSLSVDGLGSRDLASLHQLLDAGEQDRAASFHFDADRHSYIAAHGLLRLFLGAWLGRSPTQLAFNAGTWGKPALVRGGAPFSISHTRGMVAVAIAPQGEVGVDVEQLCPRREPELEIADRWFSTAEVAQIAAIEAEADKRERFMRIWNLKEAVIKATGRGLSQELTGFSVTPAADDDGSSPGLDCHEEWLRQAGQWQLEQWHLDGYLLAVAGINGPTTKPRHLKVTADGLAALADGVPVMA